MNLLRPWCLLVLIPLAWLLWLLWLDERARRLGGPWSKLVDPHLLPHLMVGGRAGPGYPIHLLLLGIGWLILVFALSGPVWRQLPQPLFGLASRTLILLDLSPSMNAADVAPSRLARARFEILDLLGAIGEGQVGLIAFGPEPFLVSPLTNDTKTISPQVLHLAPDLIPVPGPRRTDWALAQARAMLERSGKGASQVILIADDVGNLQAALEEAQRLVRAGHRLSVLGVGTTEGAPVPLAGGGFAQGADARPRLVRLARAELSELARAGRGIYLESVPDDADTQALLAAAPLPDQAPAEGLRSDQWHEEGPVFILLLLPLAALAFRRGWLLDPGGPVRPRSIALPLIAALIWPAGEAGGLDWASLWLRPDQRAARALISGQTVDAARFKEPLWRATALYRLGDLEGALDALAGLEGPEADYNRGVVLARLGRFAEAAAAFASALKQAPGHADARHNLELVRRLMDQSYPQTAPAAGQGSASPASQGAGPPIPKVTAEETTAPDERAQSLELRLRAVPDDPAGLLRQRFLLQHLRRQEEGR